MNRLQPFEQSSTQNGPYQPMGFVCRTSAALFSLPLMGSSNNVSANLSANQMRAIVMMPSMKRSMMCCSTGKGLTEGMQA